MAEQAAEEQLLDVRVAEASALYKFYLNQEKKILGTSAVIIFLTAWELVGNTLGLINPMFMSAPSLVGKAAVQLFASGEIWNDLRVSGIEFGWGYFLSVLVGVPFGIATGWYKKLSYIFDPFVNAMNATPRVALLPLVIIWLGIGILSKVGIIFLGAVFPILINSRDGVKTTPYNLLTAARRSPFNGPVYSHGLKTWCWPGTDWRHGWRALRGDRRNRFHDYRRRRDLPNR
jgi:ABC-type nitrate/sulfonate/bicarbonate transport system permease component